jgi:hypothetical protein
LEGITEVKIPNNLHQDPDWISQEIYAFSQLKETSPDFRNMKYFDTFAFMKKYTPQTYKAAGFKVFFTKLKS